MILQTAQALDEYGRPQPGAEVYVYDNTDKLATITDSLGNPLTQPLETNTFGLATYYAPVGYYRRDFFFQGRKSFVEINVGAGLGTEPGLWPTQQGGTTKSRTNKAKLNDWINGRDYLDLVGDETTKAQSLIDYAAGEKKRIQWPSGVSTTFLTLPANTRITGEGSRNLHTALAGNYQLFQIIGNDVTVEGLEINSADRTSGADFLINTNTAANKVERTHIRHIVSFGAPGGMVDSGDPTDFHVETHIFDVKFRGLRGHGFRMLHAYGYNFYTFCNAEYVGVPKVDADYDGWYFNGAGLGGGAAGGIYVTDCQTLGSAGGTTDAENPLNQRGIVAISTNDIDITRFGADGVAGDPGVFTTVNKMQMEGFKASSCGGQVLCTGVTNSQMSKLLLAGRKDLPWKQLNKDGLQLVSGCSDVTIDNIITRDNTGHGVNKAAAQAGSVQIGTLKAMQNTGRGIKSVGNSPFTSTGNILQGNVAGNYDLAGTTDFLFSTMLDSGGAVNNIGPGPVAA